MDGAPHLDVRPDLDELGRVRDFIEATVGAAGMAADRVGELVLAVDEAVSNIVMHGGVPASARIEIRVVSEPQAVRVLIRDGGMPFDPRRLGDRAPGVSPLEREAPGGFGLELLNRLADRIDYRLTEDDRNELVLVKRL